jgi:hypothetical protein
MDLKIDNHPHGQHPKSPELAVNMGLLADAFRETPVTAYIS